MKKFIGRKQELAKLSAIGQKKSASFVVIKGRRRIGKSRLAKELSHSFKHFYRFSGLPPEENVTNVIQLQEFSNQMSQQLGIAPAMYSDWSYAFFAMAERLKTGKILVLFDEISWMGSEDPAFLGKIKNLWDLYLSQNPQLFFIICGSASSWIEKNILSSTGFVGRISYTMTLEELPLTDCYQFWPESISFYEKLKVLSVTGGVPKYLEEINPKLSAEDNINNLCFTVGGFLVDEFNKIFSDIFLKESSYYKKIITYLAIKTDVACERNAIAEALNLDPNGRISEYLDELELAGFITKDYTWNIATGDDSRFRKYRLKDNYLRFYLRYIDKNLTRIYRNAYQFKSLSSLPEWLTIMGLQFENLVLNNRTLIHQALNILPEDIVTENPFYQRKTLRVPGCQIDYMIQTRFNTLYLCEIKFSKNVIGSSVISEVKEKMKSLKYPKGFSCRPVLIHVNGVSEDVVDSDFFAGIIDFSQC